MSCDGYITCRYCGKKLTSKTELEYSDETNEVFCNPECATSQYYEDAGSRPISFKELKELQANE